jgi:hypothetical protein
MTAATILGLMQDSVTPSALSPGFAAYAAYGNGSYANTLAIQARFPGAPVEVIDVLNQGIGSFLDVETGDAVPADASGYLVVRIHADVWRPGIYADLSTWASFLCEDLVNVSRPSYRIWTAHQNGVEHLCTAACFSSLPADFQADATQYYGSALDPDAEYDLSALASDFLSGPPVPPVLPPIKDVEMFLCNNGKTQFIVTTNSAGKLVANPLDEGADIAALAAAMPVAGNEGNVAAFVDSLPQV